MKDLEIIRFDSIKAKEIVISYNLTISSYSLKFIKAKFAYELSLNIIIFKYDYFHAGNDKVIYVFES